MISIFKIFKERMLINEEFKTVEVTEIGTIKIEMSNPGSDFTVIIFFAVSETLSCVVITLSSKQ